MAPPSLLDALAARRGGIVCAVGAGGKKTTLYRLALAARAAGIAPVGLTATVQAAAVPASLGAYAIAAEAEAAEAAVRAAAAHALVAYARPAPKPGRILGLPPDLVAAVHERGRFRLTLVKADGARMRLIKAPQEGEPLLVPGATTVLPVVSARAIGQRLTEAIAHRIERLEAVTGARRGEPLTAEHVARLLASEAGSLRGVGAAAAVVPVITMVDDDGRRRAAAREAAERALGLTGRFERVVLAEMRADEPVVEVVERRGGGP